MPNQLLDLTLIVDLILLALAGEALLLMWLKGCCGRGPGLLQLLPTLLSGALLLFALRSALMDAWPGWTWLALGLSGVAHLADLTLRNSHSP